MCSALLLRQLSSHFELSWEELTVSVAQCGFVSAVQKHQVDFGGRGGAGAAQAETQFKYMLDDGDD